MIKTSQVRRNTRQFLVLKIPSCKSDESLSGFASGARIYRSSFWPPAIDFKSDQSDSYVVSRAHIPQCAYIMHARAMHVYNIISI